MSEPLAPEQTHGQSFFGRFDPCLNAPFGIALAIILPAVGAILWCFRETLAWYWLLLGLLLILAGLWCLYASFAQSYRRRLRLGKWPMAEPNSLEKIVALCKSDKTPIAVGEAWAYHTALRYAGPDENILALGAWWSKVVSIKADTMRVQSGILWGEVMRILWKENRAPMDRPSFDQMALGSSVRVAAHGFFVEGWFIDYLRALQAVETGSGKVIEVQRGDTNFWEVAFEPKYVITEVEFETQPNRLVRVEGKSQAATASTTQQEVDDYVAKEAAGWQDAPFMNMSVGGTAINRKWYTFDPVGEDNKEQNCFEYLRRLAWSGLSGVDSLGDAQTIIQATPLIPFCFSRLCLELTNVELFTVQGFDWDKIALTLLKFHSQTSGRTDLRQRKRHGVVVTAFDAVVWPDELPGWFDMLYSLGIRSGTLHPGKYRTSETGKIEVIPHSSFWTQVS